MLAIGRAGHAFLAAILRRRGYSIVKDGLPPRGFPDCLRFARSCGIAPKTVYDIGVGLGTPWLYDAFPDARLVLIEALEMFRPTVESIAAAHRAECHFAALGASPGTQRMRVPEIEAQCSSSRSRSEEFSALEKKAGRNMRDSYVDVPVVTLDSIATHEGPCAIKIDVEGAEMDVLAGGLQTLRRAELVLLELSIIDRFDGEPSFADYITFMDRQGFRLFDIPELSQTSARGPLSFIDTAFVRKDRKLSIPSW